jgi:hypothetical protein
LLAGLFAGCSGDAPSKKARSAGDPECPTWGCGSNTPRVEGAPIEALNLRGEPNPQGIVLIQGSLRGRGCPKSATLDVQGGELVGLAADGQVACRGQGLVGATFKLKLSDARQVTIRIANMGRVYSWHVEPPPQPLATYLLVEGRTGAPICPQDEAWMEPWQLTPAGSEFGPVWHTPTRHAIVVRGETYLGTDATVTRSGKDAADWFNIACAGTAIAKMRLLGYDPLDRSSTPRQRQATLKMITARYCGSTSFTERGMPVLWKSDRSTPYHGSPDPTTVDEIEARWDEDGAVCLSHARAWRANHAIPATLTGYCSTPPLGRCRTESQLIDKIRRACHVPACTGSEPAFWTTHTVDHIAH